MPKFFKDPENLPSKENIDMISHKPEFVACRLKKKPAKSKVDDQENYQPLKAKNDW